MSDSSIPESPSSAGEHSAQIPAESQHSQHDSAVSSKGDTGDGNKQGLKSGNKESCSFPRLSISKIKICDKDKGKKAEDIISEITEKGEKQKGEKQKSTPRGDTRNQMSDVPINQQVDTSDMQGESDTSQSIPNTSESQSADGVNNERGTPEHSVLDPSKADLKATLTELDMTDSVTEKLKKHGSGFHVKLFEYKTHTQSQILPAINSITKPRQLRNVNQRLSYLIFFYRDKDGPEIFVAVSGMAYLYVNPKSCPEFPKKIARRLLEPTTIQLDTRNVTGDTSQVRKQYNPDRGGKINIWDVIDVVVHKFIAKPKEKASILKIFDTWHIRRPSIAIKKLSVEVMARLPMIYCIQEIISHFATIDKNEPTYQFGSSQTVEEDDETFAIFDLMQEERNRETIDKLKKMLCERITSYLKKEPEDNIQLSCDDLDLWIKAIEFRLFSDTNSIRTPIKTWNDNPPQFTDVIEVLRKEKIPEEKLCTDVKMSLRKADRKLCRKQPITSFIQTHFTHDFESYYFWYGKWLKIKLEYFQKLDESFKSIMKEQFIGSEDILPLPWVQAGKKTSGKQEAKFSPDSLQSFLADFPGEERVLDPRKIQMDLQSLCDVKEVEGGIVCSYQPKDHGPDQDPCLQIFLRMHTSLTEGMYNDCYILLDKLISMPENSLQNRFLVGDRMLIRGIEMFDVIMYNQTHTYIIHVKDGFDNNTRAVASQIRNSADILFRSLTSHMSKNVLDEMWDTFTSDQRADERGMQINWREMKSKLDKMKKDGFISLFKDKQIVYVLAVRDKAENRSVNTSEATLKEDLRRQRPNEWERILPLLVDKRYVQKEHSGHVVTDKFIHVNMKDFVEDMKTYMTEKLSRDVYSVLYKRLADTKSSVVKLEIVSLFSHFRKYQIGEMHFQLKVCFIPGQQEVKKTVENISKVFLKIYKRPQYGDSS